MPAPAHPLARPLRIADRRRDRLPAGHPGGGNLFFQLVNARYEKGAMILTSNLQPRLRRMGRGLRRRHRRYGVARSLTASRHCHPDRRRQLSAASARRSDPGSAPHQTTHTGVGLAPAPRSPTKTQEDRSLSRLITVRSICGFFLRPKCRNFTRH